MKIVKSQTLSWVFFGLAALVFLYRGPARLVMSEFNDFSVPYVSARLWLKGVDPYPNTRFMDEWVEAGGKRFVNRGSPLTTRPAYPPITIVAISPFAFLRRQAAQIVFCVVFLALFSSVLWRLRFAGPFLLGFVLLFAPIHTGISKGNLVMLSIAVALLAVLARDSWLKGVLLGFAMCLKPQAVVWLWLHYLVRREWRVAGTSFATVTCALCIAVLRLPSTWIGSLRANLQIFTAIGGVNDFTTQNPSRFELLNLQVPLYSITHDYFESNVAAWFITAILLAVWAILTYRRDFELLGLGVVSLIGLLPAYQRYYSLSIMLILFAYVAERRARLSLLLLAPFLIPWVQIAQKMSDEKLMRGPIFSTNPLMQVVILPFATWLVVAVVLIGLRAMKQKVFKPWRLVPEAP